MAGTWLWCGHSHVVWVHTDISCVRSSLGIVEIPFTFIQMICMLGRCRLTAPISHNIVNYTRGTNTANMLLFFRDPSVVINISPCITFQIQCILSQRIYPALMVVIQLYQLIIGIFNFLFKFWYYYTRWGQIKISVGWTTSNNTYTFITMYNLKHST